MDTFTLCNETPEPNDVGLRLYTRPQLRAMLHLSHRTFREMERDSLPAPIYVSSHKPCWSHADIEVWLESRKRGGVK